jgi:hypothetical protein
MALAIGLLVHPEPSRVAATGSNAAHAHMRRIRVLFSAMEIVNTG